MDKRTKLKYMAVGGTLWSGLGFLARHYVSGWIGWPLIILNIPTALIGITGLIADNEKEAPLQFRDEGLYTAVIGDEDLINKSRG